ncbi:DUF2782 domain-containing protein [Bermanella marisrubri]|uniref:DUF2782 domain-containing protein n=1 Tax=Bermanella marisrubri TaxID=207949 RepID=Q1MZ80_9GAMM|nr:DUF2782 domain-containing protein [Bermanella marisrubri]EAT11253.1 hypothetical protein RED65_08354 [Oceanobacter sp. RED65] [Bermanella marisrubri]QIZ82736.1 DUF2782 domain-containing protein [Bermanella marisrubri]
MKTLFTCCLLLASLFSHSVMANDPSEPSVVIRHSEDKTFYEYRVNGELQEIKVVPKVGQPYYLIPDGVETDEYKRQNKSNVVPPSWLIFTW